MLQAFDALCRAAWAIQPAALATMLEIAARENLNPEAVAARLGRPLDNTRTVTKRDGVAVIPVLGPIFRRANLFTQISGATSVEVLGTDLRTALDDPQIRAILLEIDSPGGEANGVGELADMIYAARGEKPIHAYIGGDGCSAAYWLASAASQVTVSQMADVGCLGVVAAVPDPAKRSAKEIQFVSSQTPRKRLDPTTDAGRSAIQTTVDALADVFLGAVARNRGVDVETVTTDFGAGGTFVGQAAVDAGLADRVGSLEHCIAELNAATPPVSIRRAAMAARGGITMGPWEKFKAHFEATDDDTTPVLETAVLRQPEPDPQLAQLEAQVARLQGERIATEAAHFADLEIAASRAFPAEREALITIYSQAATDDAVSPLAGASRVSALQGAYAARPPHRLTEERLPANQTVLANQQTTELNGQEKPLTPERRAALLSMDDLGRAILKEENGAKATR